MFVRIGAVVALGCLILAGACSSRSTNEGAGGAAGAGSGGTGTATFECADAGLTCLSCCKEEKGDIAFGAFITALEVCSCNGLDAGCAGKCSPKCAPSGSVPAECMLCVHAGELSPCIDDNCKDASCQTYLKCLRGCS